METARKANFCGSVAETWRRQSRSTQPTMKSKLWVGAVLVVAILLYAFRGLIGEDTIVYGGQHFKMSKRYWSYEDYKDDPYNLDTNELPRIEKTMLDANIGPVFGSREQFIHAVFGLKFPGYGLSSLGEKPQPDGSVLILMSVEIPQRDKDRYFVARKTANSATLVEDFVLTAGSNSVSEIKLEGTKLLYYNRHGLLLREHQITP